MHYLTHEFRLKLHAKTDIVRIAKLNKIRKKENSNNIVWFYPERALLKAISKSTVKEQITSKVSRTRSTSRSVVT